MQPKVSTPLPVRVECGVSELIP